MNDDTNLIRAANELICNLKLREYQLRISSIYISYLTNILIKNGVRPTEADLDVFEAVQKVYGSDNIEQAEAYFMTLADKFSENLGFTNFDEFKNQFSDINESSSIDEVIKKISDFISRKENF